MKWAQKWFPLNTNVYMCVCVQSVKNVKEKQTSSPQKCHPQKNDFPLLFPRSHVEHWAKKKSAYGWLCVFANEPKRHIHAWEFSAWESAFRGWWKEREGMTNISQARVTRRRCHFCWQLAEKPRLRKYKTAPGHHPRWRWIFSTWYFVCLLRENTKISSVLLLLFRWRWKVVRFNSSWLASIASWSFSGIRILLEITWKERSWVGLSGSSASF